MDVDAVVPAHDVHLADGHIFTGIQLVAPVGRVFVGVVFKAHIFALAQHHAHGPTEFFLTCGIKAIRTVKEAVITTVGVTPLVVGPGLKTGLNIKIDNPASTGADLVTGCVAALTLYGAPSIVISLGTATTIIVLDKSGAMIGGAIAPGVGISMHALSDRCALLPSASFDAPAKVVGRNTDECIRSGVVLGNASMLDGMIDRINEELGTECTVIATGGIARDIIPSCRHKIILRDDLMLQGLRIIYEKNCN